MPTVNYSRLLLAVFCTALSLLLFACGSIARFLDNKPVTLTLGENSTNTLNVSDWTDTQQLTLMNGGPYAEKEFASPLPMKFISRSDSYIVAVDDNNDLYIVDFNVTPARLVLQHPLKDEVTALTTHQDDIYIGFKNSGAIKIQRRDLNRLQSTEVSALKNISQLKVYNNSLYLLSGKTNIAVIALTPVENQTVRSTHTLSLPGKTNDFVVREDTLALLGSEFGLGIVELSNSDKFVSALKLQGSEQQISLNGSVALIADGAGGTILIDIKDKRNPRWLGSHNKLGSISKVMPNGNQAFVIDRSVRVASLNIDNAELPITGSFYKPDGLINDAVVDANNGNAIFLATSIGIEKVVFPGTRHGQISNEGINQGGTRRAYIENKIAYVADWFSGLHMYDISDPSHPRHIGNFKTPGSSKGVVVENGYAYVGDDDHGLKIIDVKDPKNPLMVGSVLTTGLAYTLKKIGDLIFLADHRGGFHIIDVKDVTRPTIITSHNTPGKSWAIDIKDNVAYVADDTSGVLVFDVSNIRQPVQIGQFNPGGYAEDIAIRGDIAYVCFFDKGLYLLDISDPSSPAVISHTVIPGNARSVVLKDKYAYIAGWESGLHIVDISNSKLPKLTGSFDTSGSAWGADLDGSHAYVWDWWGGVKVIDVSDPSLPKLESQYHASSKINKLREKNNFIYAANLSAGVQVFDVNNALNPIWTTGIDIPGKTYDVWPSLDADYLYVANDQAGLLVMDISDPFYIRQLSQTKITGGARIVKERNRKVFVANSNGELFIFDSSNPQTPKLIKTLAINATDIEVDDSTLIVASPDEGLVTFQINKSGQIARKKQIFNESAEKVALNTGYLAVSTNDNQLILWIRGTENNRPYITINIGDKIRGLVLEKNSLLVSTDARGLLHYELSHHSQPKLLARYPATDTYSDILFHNNAVFFAGQNTIASVQLLPKISWEVSGANEIKFSILGDLPTGSYHLAITDLQGNESIWPNAINVSLKKASKPKLSIEEFEKLLKQHRKNQ